MNFGSFKAQINECSSILRHLEMDNDFIPCPQYPSSPRAYFKGMHYKDIWRTCLQNRYYHFQLFDNSLLYFEHINSDEVSLSYYDFPYDAVNYIEFINSYGYLYADVGDELREDYDDYITTCAIKESVSSMRYDVSYEQYDEGKHPISHLHIGHNNTVRIRTEKLLGPLAFLYFVLRQNYPDYWKKFVKDKDCQVLMNAVRLKLDGLNTRHQKYKAVSSLDMCELYLN